MRKLAIAGGLAVFVGHVSAAVIYDAANSTYTQNFDTLAQTGTDNVWANNFTLAGWHAVRQPSPGTDLATYSAGTGSSNTGSLWSYGSSGSSDRALGALGSGGAYWGSPGTDVVAGYWGVQIKNETGLTLSSFTVTYDLEQWRNGGNETQQPLVVEWAIDPDHWFSAFNDGASTLGPIATSTAGALDGNAPENRVADVSFTESVSFADGAILWIRFRELNDAGYDHGLAVDNFRFTAVPEPSTFGLLGLAGIALLIRRMRGRS